MSYAEHTKVSPEKSRMEIEQTLARYGASAFAYMSTPTQSVVGFQISGRQIRIVISKPDRSQLPKKSTKYTPLQEEAWVDGENRRRWRALLLVIKAKLEAVESKIATFDNEFLAYVVMPNGETMGEWAAPQIQKAIDSGKMPQLMLGGGQ